MSDPNQYRFVYKGPTESMEDEMNPNLNKNENQPQTSGFAERYNENVNYARDKAAAAESGGMGHRATRYTGGSAGTSLNPDEDSYGDIQQKTSTDTGTGTTDDRAPTELETSIDSTNAGWGHRGSRYSFTAETLSHPDDRTAAD